ncbi:hypothetical protein [Paraburkholderia sp. DGU8]|uniref:hypothetical protein n=1 Tax=Paraburkholderia sp. DGU8 TaxID=3161997 RepID=UPI003465419D
MIWRIGEGSPLRSRCHTGHAFSALWLKSQQRTGTEDALWAAVQRLEEKLLLIREQLSLAEATGSGEVLALHAEMAALETAIETVRRVAIQSAPVSCGS